MNRLLFKGFYIVCFCIVLQALPALPGRAQLNPERSPAALSDTLPERTHSPRKAVIYSAVLPGLGQAYNRKYWKIPIVYAGFGTLVYFVGYNNSRLKAYTQGYLDFTDTIPGTNSYLDLIGPNLDPSIFDPVLYPETAIPSITESFKNLLKNNREYFRRNRDLSYIGIAAWYMLTMIDASVDAHLFNFDVGEDLVLKIEPSWQPTGYGMQITGIRCILQF